MGVANLKELLRLWFSLSVPVSRRAYLMSGLVLMAIKYSIEALIIYFATGTFFTPLQFINPTLSSRNAISGNSIVLTGLILWSLPFLWIGLGMSIRRALEAGYSAALGLLFLIPILNLLLMALLSIAPKRIDTAQMLAESAKQDLSSGNISLNTALECAAIGILLGLAMTGLSVYVLSSYGAALFFGTPFLIGLITAVHARRLGACSRSQVVTLTLFSILLIGGALLLFALEGIICLVMALPLAMIIGTFGSLIGYHFASYKNRYQNGTTLGTCCLVAVCAIEPIIFPIHNPTFEVISSIDIEAPPEEVWRHVVGFSEIPDTPDWILQLGIAYPLRARIDGSGVGAVRYCEFSTGPFVEPITVWNEPRVLGFSVRSQPPPMTELSPYRNLHPPHLDGTIQSQRGEFRLTPLPKSEIHPHGGTHLEGSTWYTLKIYPLSYWRVWSDLAIHMIHNRVLNHVKNLSEQPTN